MLIVGLTGGIGTGKSTATGLFADLGVPVIDADMIARELTAPGSEYSRKVISLLGDEIVGADGNIDRKILRTVIFNDTSKRHALEELLHPVIIQTMFDKAREYSTPYIILSIPLLVEAGLKDMVDRVLVIDSPDDLRIQRVMKRDGIPSNEVVKIISAQSGRQYRLSQADDIIVNDGDLESFREEIVRFDHLYREISHSS